MAFILIEWDEVGVKTFSVTKKTDIVDGELRSQSEELIGKVVSIQWKTKACAGKILQVGEKSELEIVADDLAEQEFRMEDVESQPQTTSLQTGARKKGTARGRKRTLANHAQIGRVLETLDAGIENNSSAFEPPADNTPDVVEVRATTERRYKEKYKKLKKAHKELKRDYKRLMEERNEEFNVELYPNSGVFVRRVELETRRLLSSKSTVLARNLFRLLFTQEELASHSLFGKPCNANRDHLPLPEIDPSRRDAIINFVLKDSNLDVGGNKEVDRQRKCLKKDIIASLSDFLREEGRKSR